MTISKWKKFFGLVDDTGAPINSANPLNVEIPPLISTVNSTTTPLGAGGVFNGTFELTNGYGIAYVNIYTDQDSATDGFGLIQSMDGVTDQFCDCYTITAAAPYGQTFSINPHARYFRVKYTNGATPQGTFQIQVIYKVNGKPSSHKLSDDITSEDDAELVISTIKGENPSGTYVDFKATTAGNFKISLEELENNLSVNSNTQLKVTQFNSSGTELSLYYDDPLLTASHGSRPLISAVTCVKKYGKANDGIQASLTDIWDRADAAATQQLWIAPTQARTHQITSSSIQDDGTPEGAGTGAQAVRIWGLTSWSANEVSEDVILNGTANVATSNSYVIIHRMKVIEVGSTYNINAGIITATADTDTTVTAQINAGVGQTNMAIYGIPSTQTAYMTCYHLNSHDSANPATATEVDFDLVINEKPDLNATVFINKSNMGLNTIGTNYAARCYKPYLRIPGPAIIKIQAIATSADTEGVAEFDLIMIAN